MGSKRKKNSTTSASTAKKAKAPPIPVTILSGFLGSGKTTLLRNILASKEHKLKIAVIVNDMAELNIDAQTIKRDHSIEDKQQQVIKTKKEVVTLENGCICCTLRGDLIREINRLREVGHFDYIIIESTGIAEPQQVAESFCVDPETQELAGDDVKMLMNSARLDTCATVVDALNFPTYMSSLKRFQEVFRDGLDDAEEGEGEKSIAELMVEQVEFANVIILNKADLVSEEQIKINQSLIRSLNPRARVMTGSHGNVDIHELLNTKLFNMEDAQESPGWLISLKDGVTASHGEADEYGVSSFVYRSRTPFHPKRLHSFLRQHFCFAEDWNSSDTSESENKNTLGDQKQRAEKYGSILRSKGSCWIAGRDDHEISWAQAGLIIQLSPVAPWYCKMTAEDWENADTVEERAVIDAKFNEIDDSGNSKIYPFGDRRQELVFIGTKLQQTAIELDLNTCLLSEKEMKSHTFDLPIGAYPDPLLPLLVPCDSARSIFMISRLGQHQPIQNMPGFVMTISNIALNITNHDVDIRAVKVMLDKSDSVEQGVLLVTLRPLTFEQYACSVDLMPCDEGGKMANRNRIRIEVVLGNKGNTSKKIDMMESCEVHLTGKIEPLPYSPESDEEENDEEMENDDDGSCTEGICQ